MHQIYPPPPTDGMWFAQNTESRIRTELVTSPPTLELSVDRGTGMQCMGGGRVELSGSTVTV